MHNKICFVFSGVGSQWPGMLSDLLSFKVFQQSLLTIDQEFINQGFSTLLTQFHQKELSSHLAQPLIFAMQVSLFRLLESLAIKADAVLGHSSGEIAAAVASRSLSLSDGITLVLAQQHLISTTEDIGEALFVAINKQTAKLLCQHYPPLVITTENSPSSVILSGPKEAILTLINKLNNQAIFNKRIPTALPFHSPYVKLGLAEFRENISKITANKPLYTFISSLTGESMTNSTQCDVNYWCHQISKKVQFQSAMQSTLSLGYNNFIELSPHPILHNIINENSLNHQGNINIQACLLRKSLGSNQIFTLLCELEKQKFSLNLSAFTKQQRQVFKQIKQKTTEQDKLHQSVKTIRALCPAQQQIKLADYLSVLINLALNKKQHTANQSALQSRSFFELGLDSLSFFSLAQRLTQSLNLNITAMTFIHHNSYAKLIKALLTMLEEEKNQLRQSSKPSIITNNTSTSDIPINKRAHSHLAIIASACRLPHKIKSINDLWHHLIKGTPSQRANTDDSLALPVALNEQHSAKAAKNSDLDIDIDIEKIHYFDAPFFRMSAKEAKSIPPQLKILLEVVYELIENSGYTLTELGDKTIGLYLAMSTEDYNNEHLLNLPYSHLNTSEQSMAMPTSICGQLAYYFNFQGPAITIETSGSSSLVAIHQAQLAVDYGDCDLAIVCGVNLIPRPKQHLVSIDACAAIMLQHEANTGAHQQNKAILIGSAINQDGYSANLAGSTIDAQHKVIRQAMQRAGIIGKQIDYIETIGLDNPIANIIEIKALQRAYQLNKHHDEILIGAIESHLGQSRSCAGLAGILKLIKILEYKSAPAHLDCSVIPTTKLWQEVPFKFVSAYSKLNDNKTEHIVAINSIGFSGTNAHLLLKSPHSQIDSQQIIPAGTIAPYYLLKISALTPNSLKKLAAAYAQQIAIMPQQLASLCVSANYLRQDFTYRQAVVARNAQEMQKNLIKLSKVPSGKLLLSPTNKKIKTVFAFSSTQRHNIDSCLSLFNHHDVFQQSMLTCQQIAQQLDINLLAALYPEQQGYAKQNEKRLVNQSVYHQAITFAIGYSYAQLLGSLGIKASYLLSEYSTQWLAATLAEVVSVEQGLQTTIKQGQLLSQLPSTGSQLTVYCPLEKLKFIVKTSSALSKSIALSTIVSPEQHIVTGSTADLQQLIVRLQQHNIKSDQLISTYTLTTNIPVSIEKKLYQQLKNIDYDRAKIPLVSGINGALKKQHFNAHYFIEQLKYPSNTFAAINTLYQKGANQLIALTTNKQLCQLVDHSLQYLNKKHAWHLVDMGDTKSNADKQSYLALAQLYQHGNTIQFPAYINASDCQSLVNADLLPNYPFDKESYPPSSKNSSAPVTIKSITTNKSLNVK